jgi:hypothetical protein
MPGARGRISRTSRAAAIVTACVLASGVLLATPVSAVNPRTATKSARLAPKVFTPVSGFTVKNPPTAAQVDTAVADGVDYIDCQQDQTTGSGFGSFNDDVPESAAAIIGYAVLSRGDISNLPTAIDDPACPGPDRDFQTDLTNAITWLLGQQDTSPPSIMGLGGSWTYGNVYFTYSTGLALSALGLITSIPSLKTQIANAISLGRGFLADEQQIEPDPDITGQTNCSTTPNSPAGEDSSFYCGGWDYDPYNTALDIEDFGPRSDESNTGYALTGLHLTGGLTTQEQTYNLAWQNNDQSDSTTNPYWAGGGSSGGVHNDGGGSYQPAYVSDLGDFSSNANDSGSLLFGYADDGLTISDPRVDKALQFDTDVLDTYEKTANEDPTAGYETGPHTMVYHDAAQEDGSCAVGVGSCDWGLGSGEGGFHYSLFTLSKGFGSYIPADLSDGGNWYAKIADLLVHQQDTTTVCTQDQDQPCTFGSWPADLRDDFSTLFATGLSIFALGLVATPPPPVTTVTTVTTSSVCTEVTFDWKNPTTPNYGGLYIQRSTTAFPATDTDGTRVADVEAPGTTFTDTGLVSGTTYYYALFAHDTSGEEATNGVDVKATPSCALGYRLEGGDGGIFDFHQSYYGSVGFPSPPGLGLKIYNFVGMAPADKGYWLVQSNGGVFAFGGAHFYGSLPNSGKSVDDIVGIAATASGGGYWIVASDGTVYPFGDATALGSAAGVNDIVAIISPDAGGYWLIGRDGGVFTFGDAHYRGACPVAGSGCDGVTDIVGAASPDAGGYWLVGRDGGVFTFGDAHYRGSCPGSGLSCAGTTTVVGIAGPDAGGYWIAQSDGAIDTFGDAKFFGSCQLPGSGCVTLVRPIVAIT